MLTRIAAGVTTREVRQDAAGQLDGRQVMATTTSAKLPSGGRNFPEGKHMASPPAPRRRRSGALISAAAACALAGCAVPLQTVPASRAACVSYGFQPGSDALAGCTEREQRRHTLLIYGGGRGGRMPAAPQADFSEQFGEAVIGSGDCIGAVVAGVCHGTPAPGAPTATCYGQMVGGICTGPMF